MTDKLPINFLYLGGDKCGSTWIQHILRRHPDVRLAGAKELFYFDRFYDKGRNWYVAQFPDTRSAVRTGEICHDYLYSAVALARIARDMPDDSRFIITVRDPVARTISHYRYLRKVGRTKASFEDALSSQPQIVDHSMFGKYVTLAVSHLGPERVHILDFSQLARDPAGFGKDLSEALGITFHPDLPYADRILEASSARSPGLVAILRDVGWLVRRMGQPRMVSLIKSNPFVSKLLFSAKTPDFYEGDIDAILLRWLNDIFAADQRTLRTQMDVLAAARGP